MAHRANQPSTSPRSATARGVPLVTRVIATAAGAVIAAAGLSLGAAVSAHAATPVTVHAYAPTGVGGGTTTSPDVASTKYQVQVAGTPVQAGQVNKIRPHNHKAPVASRF